MLSISRNSNHYIRRRLTIWDSTSRTDIPYTGPTAPSGFFHAAPDGAIGSAISGTSGTMVHVGDGVWEFLVPGSAIAAATTDEQKIFERVILATLQYDDYEPITVYTTHRAGS